jgi:hypothetical protein
MYFTIQFQVIQIRGVTLRFARSSLFIICMDLPASGGEVLKIKINEKLNKYLFSFLIIIPRCQMGGIR